MGMEIQAISVVLNGDDDARQCGRVCGDFLKHLLEGLPGGFAERAEFMPGAIPLPSPGDREEIEEYSTADFHGFTRIGGKWFFT
jgi:hypothetical protein